MVGGMGEVLFLVSGANPPLPFPLSISLFTHFLVQSIESKIFQNN